MIFLCAIPVSGFFSIAVPPKLVVGTYQPRVSLLSAWLGAALTIFVVEYLLFGSAYVFLKASPSDLQEHLTMLSLPLAWINRNFLTTPQKTFFDVCGVILGNSIFYGLIMYACYQPVRWAFRKAQPTQLSISGKNPTAEDD
jgi:hypothetical protein